MRRFGESTLGARKTIHDSTDGRKRERESTFLLSALLCTSLSTVALIALVSNSNDDSDSSVCPTA